MNERTFKTSTIVVATVFTVVFCVVVLPPLIAKLVSVIRHRSDL